MKPKFTSEARKCSMHSSIQTNTITRNCKFCHTICNFISWYANEQELKRTKRIKQTKTIRNNWVKVWSILSRPLPSTMENNTICLKNDLHETELNNKGHHPFGEQEPPPQPLMEHLSASPRHTQGLSRLNFSPPSQAPPPPLLYKKHQCVVKSSIS